MSDRLPVSAFIVCKDEEAYIGNCIRSLDVCGEIIIVDSGSTDGTRAIVQSFIERGWPIRLLHHEWAGYAAQKQFALEQATLPWCFNVDADERLDEDLKRALPELIESPEEVVGWRIARRPYLIGLGYTPPGVRERPILRLIRRRKGDYDLSQRVHEGIRASGEVRVSRKGSLLHYRPLPIDEQIVKENTYSSLKADQLLAEGSSPRYFRLLFNPILYFFRLYIRRGLFRCGWPGLIQAMTGSVYSFLTEAKLYQRHALTHLPPKDDADSTGARR